MEKIIDLRSDTLTIPTKKMKNYMFDAKVGDDVYGEDPSVNALEEKIAKMTGKEDALFTTSGTQANLLSLLSHCQRGEEYICGQTSHIYKHEAGGGSVLGGIQAQPISFENDSGILNLKKVKKYIKPDDSHYAITKLLCLENTYHGKILPLNYLKQAREFTIKNNLKLHLDGARVFNAAVALNVDIKQISTYVDSMSICLSKGLGAAVGSLLVGNKEFIKKARRYRKMLGGGLRQSGYLAAAGIYALDNHIKDLKDDHEKAKILVKALKKIKEVKIQSHDTNMIFISTGEDISKKLINFLEEKNIKISGYGELRLVVHRDISFKDIQTVIDALNEFFNIK